MGPGCPSTAEIALTLRCTWGKIWIAAFDVRPRQAVRREDEVHLGCRRGERMEGLTRHVRYGGDVVWVVAVLFERDHLGMVIEFGERVAHAHDSRKRRAERILWEQSDDDEAIEARLRCGAHRRERVRLRVAHGDEDGEAQTALPELAFERLRLRFCLAADGRTAADGCVQRPAVGRSRSR